MSQAAVGFRAHSGWATMVGVAGPPSDPVVLLRRRVDLSADSPGGRQPFHTAEGLDPGKAEMLVRGSLGVARTLALRALRGARDELGEGGHEVLACGLLLASSRPLPGLERILASHALIHAADGELFREALLDAARAVALEAVTVKEKELPGRASTALGIPVERLRRRLDGLGRSLGPPWRQDEKLAALVAWLALNPLRARGTRG